LEQLNKLKEEVQTLKGLPALSSLPAEAVEAPSEEKTEEEAAPAAPPPPPGAGSPPPPPPGMARKKAKYQPSVPMKQLYWNKLQVSNIETCIFRF